ISTESGTENHVAERALGETVVKQITAQKPTQIEECVTAEETNQQTRESHLQEQTVEEAPGHREDGSAEESNQQARESHLQEQPAAQTILQKPEDTERRPFKVPAHLEALKIFNRE
ncbi:hypothetical protein ANANG_G00214470, partial [Anguilla anguilla]